jgi:uncharacterized protein (UPF0332 family)
VIHLMSKTIPISELDFLKIVPNHGELSRKLSQLKISNSDLNEYAKFISERWFKLAKEHLSDAKKALTIRCRRSAYSRAYYAVYNASKAIRYIHKGCVSLKGDDHKLAGTDLPDNMPGAIEWSRKIGLLYEHRLRADYDNWTNTNEASTLSPKESVETAKLFVEEARIYLNDIYGMSL